MAQHQKEYDTLYITERIEWRNWLIINHEITQEIWLIYYKKHTGKKRIAYDDAVEEAICYGWIDSTVKRVDDDIYMQKFVPRRKKSKWSELNKERADKMIKQGKMEKAGFDKINEAKDNGNWENSYGKREDPEIPNDVLDALSKNSKALKNFLNFAQGYQNSYLYWIKDAKKSEMRIRRIKKLVKRASQNIKPGMI